MITKTIKSASTEISFPLYVTPDGKPTCCASVTENKSCFFLRTRRMGTIYLCGATEEEVWTYPGKPEGYLDPGPKCFLRNP